MNDVGRPLAMIAGGKYDNKVISVSYKFSKDDDALIKEFKPTTQSYNRSQTRPRNE